MAIYRTPYDSRQQQGPPFGDPLARSPGSMGGMGGSFGGYQSPPGGGIPTGGMYPPGSINTDVLRQLGIMPQPNSQQNSPPNAQQAQQQLLKMLGLGNFWQPHATGQAQNPQGQGQSTVGGDLSSGGNFPYIGNYPGGNTTAGGMMRPGRM